MQTTTSATTNTRYFVRHDTPAWRLQVWTAFALAIFSAVVGVWNMPSTSLERVLSAVSMLFLLFSTFALSKMMRDNQYQQVDTGGWKIAVWVAFGLAVAFTLWGLFRMNLGDWHKGYMLVSAVFVLNSSFTLAKMLRDNMEADVVEQKMKQEQNTQ